MLTGLRWLALEVKYLDPALAFYREHLDLPVARRGESEVALQAGDTDLILRAPSGVPRGGLHTHFALATPDAAYEAWWEGLSGEFDLEEHQFGSSRSLYFYDTEGNCVEIGQRGEGDPAAGITGVFEVVLEVEDLARAEEFYRALGMEVMSRGDRRKRVRLTCGAFDLELWEPHLGLADARGGVHVDLGLAAEDARATVEPITADALAVERREEGYLVRDPDGHYLTIR